MFLYTQEKSNCQKENHEQLPIQLICQNKVCENRLICVYCGEDHNTNIKDHTYKKNSVFIPNFIDQFNKLYKKQEEQEEKMQQKANQIQEQEYAIDKIFQVYLDEIIEQLNKIKHEIKQQLINNDFNLLKYVKNNQEKLKGKEFCSLDNKDLDELVRLIKEDLVENNNKTNLDFQRIRVNIENQLKIWREKVSDETSKLLQFNFQKQNMRNLISISNEPYFLKDANYPNSIGKITQDSHDLNDQKIYRIRTQSTDKLFIYENIEQFKKDYKIFKEFTLSNTIWGTNHTVYNNHLYALINSQNSKTIGKFSLQDFQLKASKVFNDQADKTVTTNAYNNNFIFLSQPGSLYVAYFTTSDNQKLKIVQLNPDSLDNIYEWITDTPGGQQYGSLFMIDQIIYGTNDSSKESPIKFKFSFDLQRNEYNTHKVKEFLNKGGWESSLHFNYQNNQLWTVNNLHFYSYDVQLQ